MATINMYGLSGNARPSRAVANQETLCRNDELADAYADRQLEDLEVPEHIRLAMSAEQKQSALMATEECRQEICDEVQDKIDQRDRKIGKASLNVLK